MKSPTIEQMPLGFDLQALQPSPPLLGARAPRLTRAGDSRLREAHSLPMGPLRQAKKKRRFRPPPPPPPPRWRLPVHRRPFWAGIAVGLGVSAALLVLVLAGR